MSEMVRSLFGTCSLLRGGPCGAAVATQEGEGKGRRKETLEAESTGYGDESRVGMTGEAAPGGDIPRSEQQVGKDVSS